MEKRDLAIRVLVDDFWYMNNNGNTVNTIAIMWINKMWITHIPNIHTNLKYCNNVKQKIEITLIDYSSPMQIKKKCKTEVFMLTFTWEKYM